MSGAMDPRYVAARRTLLDALLALQPHLGAVVLVGAQAVYARVGSADLAVAPYTVDADLAIDPRLLGPVPPVVEALGRAGLARGADPGIWRSADSTQLDVLVPEALAGPGRRGADLASHGRQAARRVRGLEGTLVDCAEMEVADVAGRAVRVRVAGTGGLLVAKLHKLHDRAEDERRRSDKDALDVLRLLRGTRKGELPERLRALRGDPLAGVVTSAAIGFLRDLFSDPGAPGSEMAARNVAGIEDAEIVRISCAALANEVLRLL